VQVDGLSTPVRVASELVTVESLQDLPVGVAGASTGPPPGAAPSGRSGGGPPSGATASGGPPVGAVLPGSSGGAAPVLLRDVAEVREAEADISGISRTDGEPSLGISITKEQDANTVEVAAGVEEQLDEVRDTLGEEQVFIVFNSATDFTESINGIVEEGLMPCWLSSSSSPSWGAGAPPW
jgi:HAE1 family hydrophobic/amphiphilic exporter-1